MKAIQTFLVFLLVLAPSIAQAFPSQTNSANVTVGASSGDTFRQWRFKIEGASDQAFEFGLNMDLSAYNFGFKVSKNTATGQVTYISLQPTNITVATTNVTFSVARTNIPPNGSYKSELYFWDASTNNARTAGRGQWEVTDSLYDDDDSTFPFPYLTNLINYYTATEVDSNFLNRADIVVQDGNSNAFNPSTSTFTIKTNYSLAITNMAWGGDMDGSTGTNLNLADGSVDGGDIASGQISNSHIAATFTGLLHSATLTEATSNNLDLTGTALSLTVRTNYAGTNELAVLESIVYAATNSMESISNDLDAAEATLSTNVALLNADQLFTGSNEFQSGITATQIFVTTNGPNIYSLSDGQFIISNRNMDLQIRSLASLQVLVDEVNLYNTLDMVSGNNIVGSGNILPFTSNAYNLGSAALPWSTGFFSAASIYLGNEPWTKTDAINVKQATNSLLAVSNDLDTAEAAIVVITNNVNAISNTVDNHTTWISAISNSTDATGGITDALPTNRPNFVFIGGSTCRVDVTDGSSSLKVIWSNAVSTYATPVDLTLDYGTTNTPVYNYIYVTPVHITNSTTKPTGEYANLARVGLLDSGETAPYSIQRNTDEISGPDDNGRSIVQRTAERLRVEPSRWNSGNALSAVVVTQGGSEDNVYLTTTSGDAWQMHLQSQSAITATNGTVEYHLMNDPTSGGIAHITNLATITEDASGNTVLNTANSWFNVLVARHAPSGTTNDVDLDLVLFLSTDDYAVEDNALSDANGYLVDAIDIELAGSVFPIGFVTLNRTAAGGGTWTAQVTDRRGRAIGAGAGGGSTSLGTPAEFSDSTFRIFDDGDGTKKIAFQASGISASQTRTLTVQDSSGTIAYTTDIADTLDDVTGRGNSTANAIGLGGLNVTGAVHSTLSLQVGAFPAGREFLYIETNTPWHVWQSVSVFKIGDSSGYGKTNYIDGNDSTSQLLFTGYTNVTASSAHLTANTFGGDGSNLTGIPTLAQQTAISNTVDKLLFTANIPDDGTWDSETIYVGTAPAAMTITNISCEVQGGTSLTFNMGETTNINTTATVTMTNYQHATQSGVTVTAFSNATIAAGSHIVFLTGTSSETGTVNAAILRVYATRD